jgi:glycosyltransferase 2 family protein
VTDTSLPAVAAPAGITRTVRLYSSEADERRFRRATDVLLLVPALVALAVLVAAYPPGRSERALEALVNGLPVWITSLGSLLFDLLAVGAAAAVLTTLIARRWFVLLQAVVALAAALVVALVAARLALGHWPNMGHVLAVGSKAARFPAVRLAEIAAAMLTIGPHLVQPLQTAARRLLALGFVGAFVSDGVTPSGNLASLLIAVVAASAARLAFGTSAGLPSVGDVAASLAELGVAAEQLEREDRRTTGVVYFRAVDRGARPLLIKVHGRDAYDNRLLEKFWRTLWYRDGGPSLRLSRSEATEHEAFVTLLAYRHGVPTQEVLRAGTTTGGDALLVLRGDARPFAAPAAGAWKALGVLHRANIAHRRIDGTTVAALDDGVGFVDFSGSTAVPTADQLMTDRAQLLVTTATFVGPERALDAAVAAVGRDGVAWLLPYLQPAALERPLLQATKAAGLDVDALRKDAAALVGEDEPTLVRLRRVTWRTLLQVALLLLAAFAILSFTTNLDYEQFSNGLADASWALVALGFLVAQSPRVTQASSTLGSVPAELPFGPVYALQLAMGYLNLALPSIAARLAVSIRFFQRQGVAPTTAVTSGAIDSLVSTCVQAVLLVLLLVFSEATITLDLEAPSRGVIAVLAVGALLLVCAVAAVFVVGRIRRMIAAQVRRRWPEVRTAFRALQSSHKVALLLLGSLGTEILFALALGTFALALGTHVGLIDLLVINISVSLFSTLIPVPGGIGVTELGLTVGLSAAGMSEESALAAVLLYRISVFYLPPAWGLFAMRWLQRRKYL